MPLQLKSCSTQNEAGTEVYIEFEDATGVYDVDDNPGGFGSPNPDRNDLAIVFFGLHKTTEEDIIPSTQAFNPLSSASVTLNISKAVNGHLSYYLFAIEVFDSGGSYSDGDVVYDNENPSAPFIKKMVDSDWVEKEPAELIGDSSVIQLADNLWIIPDAISFRNKLNADRLLLNKSIINGQCTDEDYDAVRGRYDFVDSSIEIGIDDFRAGAYAEAQLKLDGIFDLEDHINGN